MHFILSEGRQSAGTAAWANLHPARSHDTRVNLPMGGKNQRHVTIMSLDSQRLPVRPSFVHG